MPRPKKQAAIDGTPRGNSHAGSLLSALLGNAQQDISVKPQGTMTQNINDTAAPVPNRMVVTPNNIFAKGNASSMQNQLDINRMLQQQAMADQLGLQPKVDAQALIQHKSILEADNQAMLNQFKLLYPEKFKALQEELKARSDSSVEEARNKGEIDVATKNNLVPRKSIIDKYGEETTNPTISAIRSARNADRVASDLAEETAGRASIVGKATEKTNLATGIEDALIKQKATEFKSKNLNTLLSSDLQSAELKPKLEAASLWRNADKDGLINTSTMQSLRPPNILEGRKNYSLDNIGGGNQVRNTKTGELLNVPSSFKSESQPTTGTVNQPVLKSQEELKAKMPIQSPLLQSSSINSIPNINPSIALPKAAPTQEEIDNAERMKKALNLFMQNNFGVPAFKTQ